MSSIQQIEQRRSFYNKDIVNELKSNLTQQQSAILNDILKKRKPMHQETIQMLDIISKMSVQQKADRLKKYTDIVKTIIYLAISENGGSSNTIIGMYYNNDVVRRPVAEITFWYEYRYFYVGFGWENELKFSTMSDFFTNAVYIIDDFVMKCPKNYQVFVRFMRESLIVDLIDDLPLVPSLFVGQSLEAFPLSNNWFVKYVFEKYQENSRNVQIMNGKPKYLNRSFRLHVELPTAPNISKVLRKIDIYRLNELG
jgi:hypothetical protein